MNRGRAVALVLFALLPMTLDAGSAGAYGIWRYSGRADYADRYDLSGVMWPGSPGHAIYAFGQIGAFATKPPGVDDLWLTDVVTTATSSWEQWADVDFSNGLGLPGQGLLRFVLDPGLSAPAATRPHVNSATGFIDYEEIAFSNQTWTRDLFLGVLGHELGHVLGLDDLYTSSAPYSEEFVDHPLSGANLPDRREVGRRDNVMAGDVAGWYYDRTVIDNDEIAAVTWLWGSRYNEIVTGKLALAWNGADGRDTVAHHGDQAAAGSGRWWTYRGSFGSPGDEPCVDIEFPGFIDYTMHTYPVAPVRYDGDQGGGVQRFCVEGGNWAGNFELSMQSSFPDDTYRNSSLGFEFGDGHRDSFILSPDTAALAFSEINDRRALWAQVMGPAPAPASLVSLALGVLALAALRLGRRCRAERARSAACARR